MIKPIKIINTAVDITEKTSAKVTDALSSTKHQEVSESLTDTSGELLRAYQGIKSKKLFASFSDFIECYKIKLETFKEDISNELFKKLQAAPETKNFSLTKTISEHYAELNNCKKLDDVKKLYPEIKLPNMNFEDEIANQIKCTVPKSICDQVSKLTSTEEKQSYITQYLNKTISKQVKNWEIYPEFQKIQKAVTDEIIEGKFIGKDFTPDGLKYFNNKMPLRYRFLHTENREEAMIKMLKEHYIDGKGITEISIKTVDGKDICAHRLNKNERFSEFDKHFRTFIKSTEENAKQFQSLSDLTKSEISSAVMTKTWKSSGLRRDLGNETAYLKDWSLVKPVWQKTMFPDTTFYPTEKLIDAYLLNLYKAGKREADTANPILKHLQNPQMDKTKISLLKRLYKASKQLDIDKSTLNSERYKNFKSQFDVDGMKKSLEEIEEHYKNAFFKRFWTDERKMRFTNALNQNRELANKNIEASDNILVEAINNIFSEV